MSGIIIGTIDRPEDVERVLNEAFAAAGYVPREREVTDAELRAGVETSSKVVARLEEIKARSKDSWNLRDEDRVARMSHDQLVSLAEEMANLACEAEMLTEWAEAAQVEIPFRGADLLASDLCLEAVGWMMEIAKREIRAKVAAFLEAA